jgi:hypothetical protein
MCTWYYLRLNNESEIKRNSRDFHPCAGVRGGVTMEGNQRTGIGDGIPSEKGIVWK